MPESMNYAIPLNLRVAEFSYDLQEEQIAKYPLPQRDESKLLVYNTQHKNITTDIYRNIAMHLPQRSLLVFNNTKVINARLLFQKTSGTVIEIFCLEPHTKNVHEALQDNERSQWRCLIKGAKKWKHNETLVQNFILGKQTITLNALLIKRCSDWFVVDFFWNNRNYNFSSLLHWFGNVPLPPYLKRQPNVADANRYQTIFTTTEGSVAAPTAGLHFSENIFLDLKNKKIDTAFVTLHVGAGTFKPIKTDALGAHEMHEEHFEVTVQTIEKIHQQIKNKQPLVCVGTTSLRTIESLYWMGVKISANKNCSSADLHTLQWETYDMPSPPPEKALEALLLFINKHSWKTLRSKTKIIIAPGYRFALVDGLVTNFHQPQSTLLFLVAAFIGEEWKQIYNYARNNNFRFLSYGDGCLLWRNP